MSETKRPLHYLILLAGPLCFALGLIFPLWPEQLAASRVLAILFWILPWWFFEILALHITGLLAVCLLVFTGVATAEEALAPFANPIIFLFMGSFFFATAFQHHQLDTDLAQRVMTSSWAMVSPKRVVTSLILMTAILSAWMSNSATTALMLPMALGVAMRFFPDSKPAQGRVLLGIAYASSIGGIITPVGSPPNLIAIGLLDRLSGIKINFLQWVALALPLSAMILACLIWLVHRELPWQALANNPPSGQQNKPLTLSKDQKKILMLLGLMVLLWILPALVLSLPWVSVDFGKKVLALLPEGIVSLFCSVLLFLIPKEPNYNENRQERQQLLSWEEAKSIDWGTLLLFGSGLAVGSAIFESGLSQKVATILSYTHGSVGAWAAFVFMLIVFTIFFSEITSNTAAANIVIPIVIGISAPDDLGPNVLAACFGLSLAFMLPLGTPPNAIAYGSGKVKIQDMYRMGLRLNLICAGLIFLTIMIYKLI